MKKSPDRLGKDFTGGGILALPQYPISCGEEGLDAEIQSMVEKYGGPANQHLVEELVMNALKFGRQQISVADLKLINRTLREFRAANRVFEPYAARRKVVIYGSARTPYEQAEAKAAEEFAKKMVEHEFMVITGAGDGIMGAGQRGAGRENSFGLNIRLPFEQGANETIEGDKKLVTFNYFFTRKLTFVKEAEAVALFPGGFGTMDEGFELLTLIQTGKSQIIPVVMVDAPDGTYWRTFRQFLSDHLLRRKLISQEDLHLFHLATNVDDAVAHVTQFYRVFHSYRYVKDTMSIRLNFRIRAEELYLLNKLYADVVLPGGRIEQRAALPEEAEEKDIAHLPRLVFPVKRGNYGRVRQLIDAVNRAEAE